MSPREWIRNLAWINVFLSGGVPDELREVYNIGTSEPSGDEAQLSGSHPTVSVAVPAVGAAGGAPGSLIGRHFAPPTDPLGSLAPFRSTEGRTPVVDAPAAAPPPSASSGPRPEGGRGRASSQASGSSGS